MVRVLAVLLSAERFGWGLQEVMNLMLFEVLLHLRQDEVALHAGLQITTRKAFSGRRIVCILTDSVINVH
jgi:hypothetical protein